ncbi:hypothetical protein KBI23_20140 [bacterium]|nr:hypothetical protein [bacterium]MBP9806673.1 hypothetical protein [bacterium]
MAKSLAVLLALMLPAALIFTIPLVVSAENAGKLETTAQEIIAATHLASHREILNLHGIKKMAIGVSPLPQALNDNPDKSITADSLCNILSARAQSCQVKIDPKGATHLLLLTLSPLAKHDYQLLLTVRPVKKATSRPLYTLKMRATMTGHYPNRINQLIERASIIFWRNYQLAN